jgi:hypothetical protein
MKNIFKFSLLILLLGFIVPILPAQAAGNAIMRLNSAKTDYYVGDNIYVDIMVEPKGESINTVRAIMNFSGSNVLQINDFSLATAWPNQSPGRELNNTTGHINVGGFILVDAVSTNSKFGTLIFKANQPGTSVITFASGSHLISPDSMEKIDLTGCQSITINVLAAPPPANHAPVFQSIGDKSIDLGQSVSFHLSATDPENDFVTLTSNIPADSNLSNLVNGNPTATADFSWTPIAKGSYVLQFFATDDNPQGAKTGSLTVNVNVSVPPPAVNLAPVWQPVANKSIKLGESVSFHVTATDPNNDKVSLTWNLPSGSTFNNVQNDALIAGGDFSWTPTAEGVYTANFTATDDRPDSKSATLAVSIGVSIPPNHPPVFVSVAEKTVNATEILTFNVSATDPDGDLVTLTMQPLETATLTSVSTGVSATSKFTWTPKNFGVYYAVFTATDNNKANPLSSTISVRITVFGGQCPPCGGGGGITSCPLVQCQEQTFGAPLKKLAPLITSPSHPNQDLWSSNNKPQFTWQADDPGLGFTFNLDQNANGDPGYAYSFSQDQVFAFSNVSDGVWFFHLKVKYTDGWGPTATYQVKIDTTAPEFFKPSIESGAGQQTKIFFSALDKSSGVAYYGMKIDNNDWQKIVSPYTLTDQDRQGNFLSLRAVDNAGNVIETLIDLTKMVVSVEKPKVYQLNNPVVLLAAPVIDHVILPSQIGDKTVSNVLIVTGSGTPGALINLHISTSPETIFNTTVDSSGKWLVYIAKELNVGRYDLYAISSLEGKNSLPSEMVYFSLTEKFLPKVAAQFPWWLLGLLLVLLIMIYVLLRLNKKFKKKIFKEKKSSKS